MSCTHDGHLQLADLRLSIVDASGDTLMVSPTGSLSTDRAVLARRELLLTRTGANAVELIHTLLPEGDWSGKELRATLINPSARGQHHFLRASETATLKL